MVEEVETREDRKRRQAIYTLVCGVEQGDGSGRDGGKRRQAYALVCSVHSDKFLPIDNIRQPVSPSSNHSKHGR